MIEGHFYYITDQYFIDFPDPYLMQNKETINGQAHDRPCFYALKDQAGEIYCVAEDEGKSAWLVSVNDLYENHCLSGKMHRKGKTSGRT